METPVSIARPKDMLRRWWISLWRYQNVLLRRLPIVGARFVRKEIVKRYERVFGAQPRLEPPLTFNEHIIHRIIHDRDPRLKIICDKVAAKQFIRERVGSDHVVPTLGVWRSPRDIDWALLPEQFVLKPNHAAGQVAIVREASDRNADALTEQAEQWLSRDYFDDSMEWGYRGLPRRLLAEPLLVAEDGGPVTEAQVYAFFGKAAFIRILVGQKSTSDRKSTWFDAAGRRLAIATRAPPIEFDLADRDRVSLCGVAEKASNGFGFLRVDCYLTSHGVKIGELTAYSNAGLLAWQPRSVDELLGKLWRPDFDLSLLPGRK